MFRIDLLSIIRSLSTVFTAIGVCDTSYVDWLIARSGWNVKKVILYVENAVCWFLFWVCKKKLNIPWVTVVWYKHLEMTGDDRPEGPWTSGEHNKEEWMAAPRRSRSSISERLIYPLFLTCFAREKKSALRERTLHSKQRAVVMPSCLGHVSKTISFGSRSRNALHKCHKMGRNSFHDKG